VIGSVLKTMSFHRENHYVPRLYLKRFASPSEQVWTYRILVPHSLAPDWKPSAPRGIAYHEHLYTRIASGTESDEIENWLNDEFEAPAEEPIRKATSGLPLTPRDWQALARFLAAQDVRTPARMVEGMQRWEERMPEMLNQCLSNAVSASKAAKESDKPIQHAAVPFSDYIPLRLTREPVPGQKMTCLKAETVLGRSYFLYSIRRLLTHTLAVLLDHKWTILYAPDGSNWFTSDDPVIKLNHCGPGYDFEGGWGKEGTEIFMPLDPRHMLYTQVGKRPPQRGTVVTHAQLERIRRAIAEHAHRYIFAPAIDIEVPKLRSRTVNAEILRDETEQWRKWHEEQTRAERDLAKPDGVPKTMPETAR